MDRETSRITKKFVAKIRKVYNPQKIILFGSRAKGTNLKTSDFDFIIVSEKFKDIPFIFRPSEIYDFWKEKVDIVAICYTPEEFKRKSKEYGLVRLAIKRGVVF